MKFHEGPTCWKQNTLGINYPTAFPLNGTLKITATVAQITKL